MPDAAEAYWTDLVDRFGPGNIVWDGETKIRRPDGLVPLRLIDAPQAGGADVIIGYATRFNKAHEYKGHVDVFAVGCFARTLCSGRAVRLLMHHDESKLVATTANALELHSDDKGLAFKCRLPSTVNGTMAKMMVRRLGRAGMSVGYEIRDAETKVIEGCSVRILYDCDLVDISLVERGAVPQAFAVLKGDDGQALPKSAAAGSLLVDEAYQNVRSEMGRFAERIAGAFA
jgi:HK97 family phage prohead protease